MFKCKLHIYKNIDWKEIIVEKEFNNEKEYLDFLFHNENFLNYFDLWFKNKNNYFDQKRLEEIMENVFDRKILEYLEDDFNEYNKKNDIEYCGEECQCKKEYETFDENNVLAKYEIEEKENELKTIEKHKKKEELNQIVQKLYYYKNKFEDQWNQDLVEQVNIDIKCILQKINSL